MLTHNCNGNGGGDVEQYPGEAPGTQQRPSSLFRRAGGGGVFFVFFILVWRSLSNYENVEQMAGGIRCSLRAGMAWFLLLLLLLVVLLVTLWTFGGKLFRHKIESKPGLSAMNLKQGIYVYSMYLTIFRSDVPRYSR